MQHLRNTGVESRVYGVDGDKRVSHWNSLKVNRIHQIKSDEFRFAEFVRVRDGYQRFFASCYS